MEWPKLNQTDQNLSSLMDAQCGALTPSCAGERGLENGAD